MLKDKIFKIVEKHLKLYPYIDEEIEKLKKDIEFNTTARSDVNSYLKSKGKTSKTVENQAVHNASIKEKIAKYEKWKSVIEEIITIYKEKDEESYKYIKFKFFRQYSKAKIEMELFLSRTTQDRLRNEIVSYIAIFAAAEGLIKLSKKQGRYNRGGVAC